MPPPLVELRPRPLLHLVRPNATREYRLEILETWYRDQVRTAAQPLMENWEKKLGVQYSQLRVQRMRTRPGSCNPKSRGPLERTQNARCQEAMDYHLPRWRRYRQELNRAPLSFEKWEY